VPGATAIYNSLLAPYNKVPAPTSGQGPYGLVPGPTPLPPSTFDQLNAAVPGLSGAPDILSANIMSELQGEISPQAIKNMQDTAARFGVSSGMPGSNAIPGSLANNANLLANIETTQQLQQTGEQNYLNAANTLGGQQLNPGLINQNQGQNATLAAAPDPTAAAQQQLQNYYAALALSRGGPGGGTRYSPIGPSGTGTMAPPITPGTSFSGGTFTSPTLPPGTTDTSGTIQSSSPYNTVDQSQLINDLFNSDFGMAGSGTDQSATDQSGAGIDYTQAYSNPEDYYASILAGG